MGLKKIKETFWQTAMKCIGCGKKFEASTMDISADAPIYCPHCGAEN